jgi:hypothetical protein
MYSPEYKNILQIIEIHHVNVSGGMVGHVAYIGEKIKMHTKFWYKNLKESDHLEDLGIDERIISKWILKNSM